jgi:hypothetical protein
MTVVESEIKTLSYGSKSWANELLRIAIAELKNTDRVLSARRFEVFAILNSFKEHGFWWQEARLRNQINLAIKKKQFSFTELSSSDVNQEIEKGSQ